MAWQHKIITEATDWPLCNEITSLLECSDLFPPVDVSLNKILCSKDNYTCHGHVVCHDHEHNLSCICSSTKHKGC